MADLNRLHDFAALAGQPIVGQDVDDEFDQLVSRLNDVPEDALLAALAEKLGVSQAGTVRRGKSIIATEEARSNTAYGTLTTPDRVQNVVLPQGGLLFVAFQGMWKSSDAGAGAATIFLGANEVKTALAGFANPSGRNAQSGEANEYRPLASSPEGLVSEEAGAIPGSSYAGDVTTGQLVGGAAVSGDVVEGYRWGFATIFADGGTYTVSVQYKASSGSVTAKNRKLWVWTLGF